MGRGRAKAKQQKVARDLKYNTHSTDFEALRRELTTTPDSHVAEPSPGWDDDPEDDEGGYASASR